MGKKGVTLSQTNFPLYTIKVVGDRHFIVAGGGGQAKTGIPNAIEIYELQIGDAGGTVATKVFREELGSAVMNCTVFPSGKDYTVAAGMDGTCHLYTLRHKVTTLAREETADHVRKRKEKPDTAKGGTESLGKVVKFEVEPGRSVQTDFQADEGFQKVVQTTQDHSVMVTGGGDGHIRAWKVPTLEKLYETKAHTDEVDDICITPPGHRIVSVSRDGHGYVWNTKDGSRNCELMWHNPDFKQYRYRHCRFGIVINKADTYHLFTTHIPRVRAKKPQPCYLTKWDSAKFVPVRSVSTGLDITSALAVSDNGIYIGLGSIAGSVSVYIAFSLQKLYHVSEAHSIFVTGLEFVPSGAESRIATGDYDFTLLSISADNQVKLFQQEPGWVWSPLWAIVGFIVTIYLFFWFISEYGL